MRLFSTFLLATALSVAPAFAEGPNKEDRAKMAEHHEKMAACLKSDKPMDECRKEMKDMKAMHASCDHDGGACPMGEQCMKHKHGKHGKSSKESKSESKE